MGGVHVAVDVGFDSGVHRDDADAADDFGAVGYFRGTEHELVGEEVHVLVDVVQAVVCHAQRAGASELDAPFLNEGDDGVLDDFGVHLEGRDAGVAPQGAEYGVGDVSHARLQREEGGGDDAPLHVGSKEVGYVLSDFIRHRVGRAESACFVGDVHFHHADYLFRVDLYVGQSDAVAGTDDRDGAAVGRTFHFVEVVHADDAFAVRRVQLDDDAVCQAGNGGRKSYACREVDASVVGQFAGFHDSGGDVS